MKIIGLQAENVKRLKAVSIEPDGTLQVIAGKNGAGKSSLLDSVFMALGGGDASKTTTMPIRQGERKARVRLDLGDLIVTRTWTQAGTKLKVEGKDGSEYKSPQTLLDSLVGKIGFDPLEFTRMSARKQRELLLELLGIDLDSLDAERAEVYRKRTDLGRDLKALGEIPEAPDDAPTDEKSASELIEQIQHAERVNRQRQHDLEELSEAIQGAERLRAQLKEIEARIGVLRDAENEGELDPIDVSTMQDELAGIEEYNRRARANAAAKEKALQASKLNRKISKATQRIAAIDREKQETIEQADFPVAGLGFDEDGVTLNGLPFEQASSAEQIKVSVAIGMALNPDLRVLMVKDGSLLDSDSLRSLYDMAVEHDHQVLVEAVFSDDPAAIQIEDGEVK